MERIKGVRIAIPARPYLDFILTIRLLRLENLFLGFFRLNHPVFRLNQFHNFRIPELRYMNTIIPKVPDEIPKSRDSQKLSFSFRIKNGTVIANLKDAISAAIIAS